MLRMAAVAHNELLTVDDVARRFRVTRGTVRRWVSSGELPASRIGRTIRIDAADLPGRGSASGPSPLPKSPPNYQGRNPD